MSFTNEMIESESKLKDTEGTSRVEVSEYSHRI